MRPTGSDTTKIRKSLPTIHGSVIMETSNDRYNCLIHAFFTSLSDSYRRLSLVDKHTIVECFRLNILPSIIEDSDAENKDEMHERTINRAHDATRFLTDSELQLLGIFFKVNIFIYVALSEENPCPFNLYHIHPEYSYIIMNNAEPSTSGHFESVRTNNIYKYTTFNDVPSTIRTKIATVIGYTKFLQDIPICNVMNAVAPVAAATGSATASNLPNGWTEHKNHQGKPYYHKATTGESKWNRPTRRRKRQRRSSRRRRTLRH
jgi:hypothetical protein